jgi:ribosomal protein L37AE/L43A
MINRYKEKFMSIKNNIEWLQSNGKYKCPICKKEYSKKGIGTHVWRSHGLGKNHKVPAWNKGLTKENNDIVKRISESVKENHKKGILLPPPSFKGKNHTEKSKENIAKSMRGNTNGNGRGKITYYKGIKMKSTWEAKAAKYLDDNNIDWIYEEKYYIINEKQSYTPDFFIYEEGKLVKLIEVKGYFRAENKLKFNKFKNMYDINIELWDKDELKKRNII